MSIRLSLRHWISIVTAILILVILFLSRNELIHAWQLLSRVNIWILLLLIPLQALSYYAVGAMIFSYLKQKKSLNAGSFETAKMALELNFVNHILPSGGVSGASYMTWRLKHLGVGAGRATLAQVVRFVATFGAFLVLLIIATLAIALDGEINRLTLLMTTLLVSGIIFGLIVLVYVINDHDRLIRFSWHLSVFVNKMATKLLRRKKPLLQTSTAATFFSELHEDYATLQKEPRLLLKPFIWGIIFNITEIGMFWVTFWALGTPINPAPLLIAYGLASIAGFFIVTPGGVGGYEAIMIFFLASAGIAPGATVAAVILTRTLLVLGTIASGYTFYQLALNKYGKQPVTS